MECTRDKSFQNRISLVDKLQSPGKIFQSKGWNKSNFEISQPLTESNMTQEYEHKSNLERVLNIHQENISKQQRRSKINMTNRTFFSLSQKDSMSAQYYSTRNEMKYNDFSHSYIFIPRKYVNYM